MMQDGPERPRQRSDCERGPRPCPWATCPHSLLVDVTRRRGGAADLVVHDRTEAAIRLGRTCVLDIADEGRARQQDVADLLGITHQMVALVERVALRKLRARATDGRLREQLDTLIQISDRQHEAHGHMQEDSLPTEPTARRQVLQRRAARRRKKARSR